jgi:hypothetical protein
MANDIDVKLEVFESALWDSYQKVLNQDHTLYVSLHKVMYLVGLPLNLFNERLQRLWSNQFITKSLNRYSISLEADAKPTEYYRLRKQHIVIDNCPMFIIQMSNKKDNK